VVGDGPLLQQARRRAKRQKLKINFTGFARDSAEVASMINRSRLLMMTSLNEGGPRVVLESLACGVPVVATPVGIVPDVLPPECIEEWNAGDLAAKVSNLLSDHELYDRVREAGLFTAAKFERHQSIADYANAIKELAK
jgi:glycosyltransferase involved in cell wall biosynthesis